MLLTPLIVLIILIVIHFAIDIQFQSDFVAMNKNKYHIRSDGTKCPIPWYYVMASHTSCHGLAVGVVIYLFGGLYVAFWLGIAEFISHFIIDMLKCAEITDIYADQELHFCCKIIWVAVFYLFMPLFV